MSGEQHVLANGLTVAADPLPGRNRSRSASTPASARARSRSGSAGSHISSSIWCSRARAGATPARSPKVIEDVGGSFNAWTGARPDRLRRPGLARDLPLVAELIADLVRAPHFDPEHLEREKQVILSELGEATDAPDDLVHDHLFEAAFGGQALGRPVLGSERTVRAITRQDCRDWLEQQFVPSRLVLAASGKVDPVELLALAERLFGDMEPTAAPAIEPAHFTGGLRNDARSFEQAHWCLAFAGLPADDPRQPALGLFVQALGGGTSSRLFQELREERGLAYSVYAWNQAFADTGLVGIGCAAERGQAAESVQLARDVLAATADGLSEAEFNRARAQAEAGLLMALETVQARADQMARSIEVFGRILPLEELLEQIRGVSVEEARAAGRALLEGPAAVASVGAKLAIAA